MTPEEEVHAELEANLLAASHALGRDDWTALRALAEQETRLMDSLRAIWSQRSGTCC